MDEESDKEGGERLLPATQGARFWVRSARAREQLLPARAALCAQGNEDGTRARAVPRTRGGRSVAMGPGPSRAPST